MFSPTVYENSRPAGVAVLEVPRKAGAGPRRFVPLKLTHLSGEVIGPFAAMTVTHVYGYTRQQCDGVLEAVYRFPLPGDAAVTKVAVTFGDVEIKAELKAREKAEADYSEAKLEGRQAALVTRESPDVFTLQVTGILPDEDIHIETSYVQLARPEGPGWTLRLPLTTAPRYVRSDEVGSAHAQGQPLALLRDPGHRFALDLLMPGASLVESPTHALDVGDEDGRTRVRLRDGEVIPDRDCVLSWQLDHESDRPKLHLSGHWDRDGGHLYFVAMVAPPTQLPRTAVPREAILLVDHSGSMTGPKWEAADWAVRRFLDGMGKEESFGLGVFHDSASWLSERTLKADDRTLDRAARFLADRKDSGGTQLGVALEQALSIDRAGEHLSRHLLVITDAEVSDEGRVLRLADEESQREDRRRISVLCIDAAPNSFLARELAERGGGAVRFLTSAPDQGDIATALDEVMLDWSQPVLTNLRLELDRPGLEPAGRERCQAAEDGWSAVDIGDLPAGRAIWVCGRVRIGEAERIRFRLADSTGELAACAVDIRDSTVCPALKALFGARKVIGIEFLMQAGYDQERLAAQLERLGYEPGEVLGSRNSTPRVYSENVARDCHKYLEPLLLRESLEYGLLSSATGFVAVRSEAGKVIDGTVPVASGLPAGWSDDFASAPPSAMASVAYIAPAYLASPGMSQPSTTPKLAMRSSARFSPLSRLADALPHRHRGAEERPTGLRLFEGRPSFSEGNAVLFDSSTADGRFTTLRIRFPEGAPDASRLDPGLVLMLYLEDLVSPMVRVRLVDLVRQGGIRPINLATRGGDRLVVTLVDPSGAWTTKSPRLEVWLE